MKDIKERKVTTIDLSDLRKDPVFNYAIKHRGIKGLVSFLLENHMNSLKPEFDKLSKEEKAKYK